MCSKLKLIQLAYHFLGIEILFVHVRYTFIFFRTINFKSALLSSGCVKNAVAGGNVLKISYITIT